MTEIGVITDSHRAWRNIDAVLPLFENCRYILHLGDHESDMDDFSEVNDRLIKVPGNCDFFSMMPGKRILEAEGVKIFICHGDAYGVKMTLRRLAEKAAKEECALALYGHTHIARDCEVNGVRLINPGALKDGRYAIVTIDDTKISAQLMDLG